MEVDRSVENKENVRLATFRTNFANCLAESLRDADYKSFQEIFSHCDEAKTLSLFNLYRQEEFEDIIRETQLSTTLETFERATEEMEIRSRQPAVMPKELARKHIINVKKEKMDLLSKHLEKLEVQYKECKDRNDLYRARLISTLNKMDKAANEIQELAAATRPWSKILEEKYNPQDFS